MKVSLHWNFDQFSFHFVPLHARTIQIKGKKSLLKLRAPLLDFNNYIIIGVDLGFPAKALRSLVDNRQCTANQQIIAVYLPRICAYLGKHWAFSISCPLTITSGIIILCQKQIKCLGQL